ncbi:hypothetical protein X748_27805 [Mesorhizobium sp. LNJC386A00]|nr:hypothetical protein X748_27805 [Mesorhizobium sp. LNJC386A00]
MIARNIEAHDFGAAQAAGEAKSNMARPRRPRSVPRSSVSSMATRSSRRMASF